MAITSRNKLFFHDIFLLKLIASNRNSSIEGIGEAAPIVGLSRECTSSEQLVLLEKELQRVLTQLTTKKNYVEELLSGNFTNNLTGTEAQAPQATQARQNLLATRLKLQNWPCLVMAVEMALLNIASTANAADAAKIGNNTKSFSYFNNSFTSGHSPININGLVWMGENAEMQSSATTLLTKGFRCVKLKINASEKSKQREKTTANLLPHNLQSEIALVQRLREKNPNTQIRLDANGSFASAKQALLAFQQFAALAVHSVEQPFPASFAKMLGSKENSMRNNIHTQAANKKNAHNFNNNATNYANIWQNNLFLQKHKNCTVKIAFDEELIFLNTSQQKILFLQELHTCFKADALLVLKPTLLGGFAATQEWIKLATQYKIGWWITSALESNYGLTAVAQFTAQMLAQYGTNSSSGGSEMFQGLGTGSLYSNNFYSPIHLKSDTLWQKT